MDFLKCCRSRIRRRAGGTRVFQACVSFGTKLLCQYAGLVVEGTTRAGGTRVRSETLRPAGIGAGASEWSGGGALRLRSLCMTHSAATPRRCPRDCSLMPSVWPMMRTALTWIRSRRARAVAGAPSHRGLQYSSCERTKDLLMRRFLNDLLYTIY